MEISKLMERMLRTELQELELELVEKEKALNETRDDGDLRENDPYHIARDAYNRTMTRILELRNILSIATIIEPFGGTITIGRLLKITYCGEADAHGNLLNKQEPQEFILLFGNEGESIIGGILSRDSDLGKLIENGREDRYYLSRGRVSLVYDVEFLGEDHFDDFLKRFPLDRQAKISSLLRGEF